MIILPANTLSGGYDVDNSCRFDGSNDYLTKTFGSSPTSNKIGTVSYWTKRSGLGASMFSGLVAVDTGVSSYGTNFTSGDNMDFWFYYDNSASAYDGNFTTNAKFRDVAAWMHVVFAWDTTQATNTNRLKLYINGRNQKDVSGYSAETYPDQDQTVTWGGTSAAHRIGANPENGNNKWNGYMAEVVYCDGTQYAASDFGEFDSDSPTIWKPKDVSGLTFGGNGFYLDFKDSSALGNDVSGNNNDFTATGIAAIDQCVDTPTNNFATANPLNVNSGGPATFAEGNTEVTSPTATGTQFMSSSTLGMTAGKYYCEAKIITVDSLLIGVSANVAEDARDDAGPGWQGGAQSVGILASSGNKYIDDAGTTHGAGFSADDIIMIALDLTNENVYFGKNGQWFDGSGNADEAAPNSAIGLEGADHSSAKDGAYFFAWGDGGGSSAARMQWNFGNPQFSISSGNTDGKYGNFEYAPPSGYYALCTKRLAEFG